MLRLIRNILLFGFLGAVTNYAVAWGIAAWKPIDAMDMFMDERRTDLFDGPGYVHWTASEYRVPGMCCVSSSWRVLAANELCGASWVYTTDAAPDELIPHWAPWMKARGCPEPGAHSAFAASYGWPALSAYWSTATFLPTALLLSPSSSAVEARPSVIDVRGLEVGTWRSADGSSVRVIMPTAPLWPGILLNTLLYGGLLWVAWTAPRSLMRRARRRMQRCAKCGYDLRGSPTGTTCPECGAPEGPVTVRSPPETAPAAAGGPSPSHSRLGSAARTPAGPSDATRLEQRSGRPRLPGTPAP